MANQRSGADSYFAGDLEGNAQKNSSDIEDLVQ